MTNQAWLLIAGQYDDREVVGIVLGPENKALKIAIRMTLARAGQVPGDMVKVSVEPTKVYHS